ncbi:15004_t:CDS:2 [Entrophospora sp. SA101]|nr:15004_t:CDS:2 [Entrophospora sp. SA101]
MLTFTTEFVVDCWLGSFIEIFKLISPGISDSNLENDPGIGHRKRSRYNHNESLATEALQ